MAGMFSYTKAAMERSMKVQKSFCGRWRRRSRGTPRSLASAIGTCAAGASATRSSAMTRCSIGGNFRVAVRAHGESRQHRQHPESPLADRSGALASQPGGLQRDRASALGGHVHSQLRTKAAGHLRCTRQGLGRKQNGGRRAGCWSFNSNRTCHVLTKPDILTC